MKLLAIVSIAASVFVGEANATSFLNVANGVWSSGLNTGANPLTGGAVDPHYVLISIPAGCTLADPTCLESAGNLFGPAAYVVMGSDPLAAGSSNTGVQPLGGTWVIGNANTSQWIGPKGDQVGPANPDPFSPGTPPGTFPNLGTYPVGGSDTNALFIYRLIFSLTSLNMLPSSATVTLGWLSDDKDNGLSPTDPNYKASSIRVCTNAGAPGESCQAVTNSGNDGFGANALTQVTIGPQYFSDGLLALDFLVYNRPLVGYDPSGLRVEILSADATQLPEPGTLAMLGLGLTGILVLRRKR
ncbi:MAG: PEP-CTERM sorting domain-containing protein [Acidobacteria bacterium]|nr:PEP-CTERM sorting domain-containing protein [Acidobacteriota bacterium]